MVFALVVFAYNRMEREIRGGGGKVESVGLVFFLFLVWIQIIYCEDIGIPYDTRVF